MAILHKTHLSKTKTTLKKGGFFVLSGTISGNWQKYEQTVDVIERYHDKYGICKPNMGRTDIKQAHILWFFAEHFRVRLRT